MTDSAFWHGFLSTCSPQHPENGPADAVSPAPSTVSGVGASEFVGTCITVVRVVGPLNKTCSVLMTFTFPSQRFTSVPFGSSTEETRLDFVGPRCAKQRPGGGAPSLEAVQ